MSTNNHQPFTKLFFKENDFTLSGKTCSLNGKRVFLKDMPHRLKQFFKDQMMDHPFIYEAREELNTIISKVVLDLKKKDESVEAESYELPFELSPEMEEELQDIRENHMPVVDLLTGDSKIMRNDGDQVASPIHFEIYKNQFVPKEWGIIKSNTPVHIFTYDVRKDFPKFMEVSTHQGLKSYPTCNLYIPPKWTFQENKREPLHEDHRKVIETRFANIESLERYMCVLYHTITSRSRVICGLVHPRQGTGKSIVNGRIPGALVGATNFAQTGKGFMGNSHKDILLNKRVVFLDEHRLLKSNQAEEKQFTEDMIYINPKGKPAITVPNNLNWFMNSNRYEDIYTDPMDRRHYFLDDSGRHIVEEFGRDFVDSYMHRLNNDDEFVANLGYYVLNNFSNPKYGEDAVYRGPTFEKVVRATCFPGYEEIIEELESGEVMDCILYSDCKNDYNRKARLGKGEYFPRLDTFMDFFKAFRWGGKPVCEVERLGKYDCKLIPVEEK